MNDRDFLGQPSQSVEGEKRQSSETTHTHPKGEHSGHSDTARLLEAEQPCPPTVGLHASQKQRLDMCRFCRNRVPRNRMSLHQRRECEKKPRRRPAIDCACGCGTFVEQPERGKQRNFVSAAHYKRWCVAQKRGKPNSERCSGPVLSDEDKELLQMAPRRLREAAVAAEAARKGAELEANRTKSYATWGACLGVQL